MRTKFFALEDNDDSSDIDLVPETQAEVEAGAAEVDTRAREIDDEVQAVEDAVNATDSLGEVQDVAQDAVDAGTGLDESAARIAEVTVESIRNSLGLPTSKRIIPAMESFGSTNSRVAATKVVIEGIGDWLKKIWEGIKAAASRIWEKIKSFFVGITRSTKNLTKHLESLQSRVQSLDDNGKPEKEKLDNEGLAAKLSIKKKADASTASDLIEAATNLLKTAPTVVEAISHSGGASVKLLRSDITTQQYFAEAQSGEAAVIKAFGGLQILAQGQDVAKKLKKTAKVNKAGTAGRFKESVAFGPFVNAKNLYYFSQLEIFGAGTPDAQSIVEINVYFGKDEKNEADDINALKRDEMHVLISKAIKLSDALESHEKNVKAAEDVAKATRTLADEVIKGLTKKAENSDKAEATRVIKELGRDIQKYNIISSALTTGAASIAFETIKAVGDYVSASLYNYGDKKK